jgi:hypothetical protein
MNPAPSKYSISQIYVSNDNNIFYNYTSFKIGITEGAG